MPPASSKGGARRFLAAWRDELPRVAASLTTALVLFLISLTFAPVRQWLFGQEVGSYPLICTADPVAAPDGRRIVEFYLVNRSRDNFSGEELQRRLDETLRGSGTKASATITLPFNSEIGRIERVYGDDAFNEGKGELVPRIDGRQVRIGVGQIHGGAIMRIFIVLADMPDIGPIPRDAKIGVPFDYLDMQEACYTRL
jgi:hypothetical protein